VFEIVRDCYEAFALYSFGRYLVACLGIHESHIFMLEHSKFQLIIWKIKLRIAWKFSLIVTFVINLLLLGVQLS
jgi:hypothetical protein